MTEARRTGNRKSPSNAFARALRDLALPFFLRMGVKNVQRVYSYRIDWDEPIAHAPSEQPLAYTRHQALAATGSNVESG